MKTRTIIAQRIFRVNRFLPAEIPFFILDFLVLNDKPLRVNQRRIEYVPRIELD